MSITVEIIEIVQKDLFNEKISFWQRVKSIFSKVEKKPDRFLFIVVFALSPARYLKPGDIFQISDGTRWQVHSTELRGCIAKSIAPISDPLTYYGPATLVARAYYEG